MNFSDFRQNCPPYARAAAILERDCPILFRSAETVFRMQGRFEQDPRLENLNESDRPVLSEDYNLTLLPLEKTFDRESEFRTGNYIAVQTARNAA